MSQKFKYLERRAVVPHKGILDAVPVRHADPLTPDPDNVQGDVYFMFPKKWERFLFFKITDTVQFRKDLAKYAPLIKSSRQTARDIHFIHDHGGSHTEIVSTGIAFARAGLNVLGIKQNLGDPHFDRGSLILEKYELGDRAQYDQVFDGDARTHGYILLTAREQKTCREKLDEIRRIFNNSITVEQIYEGRVRVGDGEHFGWRDGISQPSLDCGWDKSKPGQRVVKSGVIIIGYPGDPVYDNKEIEPRPSFTKDGAFVVFRKLEQNVLFLEDDVNKNWSFIPAEPAKGIHLTVEQRKALFGARWFGRFKSGVPLALSPYIDNHDFLGPDKINNFNYTEIEGACPFSAHVRKTAPRQLDPIVRKQFLDASVIIRAGIPYGEEISDEERKKWQTLTEEQRENAVSDRGLLFVCYQSSIHNGFYRQTTAFANNDFFPLITLEPTKTGQDPIIGGPQPVEQPLGQANLTREGQVTVQLTSRDGQKFEVDGVARKVDTSVETFQQKFFVTSRGGDYYFVPSISTVKAWAQAN